MTKMIPWNKFILEKFIEVALLTKEEEMIMRTRVAGWTITEQSMKLNMSTSKVSKMIAILKKKYDEVQKYEPLLPPRKNSAKELYMDTH